MDEQIDQTNYEQEHPRHPTEDEYWDRAQHRLDKALSHVDELEARIARNAGHTPPEKAAG